MSASGLASLVPISSASPAPSAATERPKLEIRQPQDAQAANEILVLGRNSTTRISEARMSRRIAKIQWIWNGTKPELTIQALSGQGFVYVNSKKLAVAPISQPLSLMNGDVVTLQSPDSSTVYKYRVDVVDMIPGDSQQTSEPELAGVDASQEFSCAICLDVMVDPVTAVPCGHSFCRDCLSASFHECPNCRAPFQANTVPARSLDHAISLLIERQPDIFTPDDVQQYLSRTSRVKRAAPKQPQRRSKRMKLSNPPSAGSTAADAIVID